ncbi:hypothetical protein KJ671_02200 [Patescibacteria group bacterium]|nr:hypothetical protein [Patescibacteria group bacterium]
MLNNPHTCYKLMNKNLFWIFGSLQAVTLGFIVFFLLGSLGLDSRIVLSVLFPLFTLIVEYMIYSK